MVVVAAAGLAIAGYQLVAARVGQGFSFRPSRGPGATVGPARGPGATVRPARGVGVTLPAALDVPRGAGSDFNVVLITLDTLRSDRVGCYGYQGVKTPAIDALASGGIRFADAVTVVPMTLPAHASILTGDYPPAHGVRDNGTYRLVAERETLAERLKTAGYATAAFIAAFVLDRRYGLDQGFDVYDDQITPEHRTPGAAPLNPQRRGNVVTDLAIRWVAEHQRAQPDTPFFAWIHLFDPHTPYNPPEPFKTRYASNPYDGEVAYTDEQVGRFVDKLRELGLLAKTLVVLVGDHGEGLGDHGESTHSLLIYGATMRVPLIFYGPALIPPGRVVDDRVVAVVDIKPTILDLLGLEPGDCDGVSLLQPAADADRAVYLETLAPKLNHGWSPLHGLRRHRDKYIQAPTPEYYDLSSDPGEQHNLWDKRGSLAGPLAERLTRLLASSSSGAEAGEAAVTPDQAALEKLAALGYVRGPAFAAVGTLPDPKEMIARSDEKLAAASALMAARRHAEAIALIKKLIAATPGDASLWSLLSVAQSQAGLLDEAVASRMRLIELQPNDANGWVLLANLQYATGDVDAFRASLAEAERLEPELGGIYISRAVHAKHAGQYKQALALCREAARRDPTRYRAKAWTLQGKIYEEMGQPAAARAAYERARQAEPP